MQAEDITYLDHASTSYPKPPAVHEAVQECLQTACVNPGRGAYRMASRASEWVSQTRASIASFFGLGDPSRVVFAFNCTDAINMAIKGILEPKDRVISTLLEHNSVSRPLHHLEKSLDLDLEWLTPDKNGFLDPEELRTSLQQKPAKLVVVSHASNVVGAIQPIAELGKIAREAGSLFMVDAAQTAGVVPIDMTEQAIDILAWPGHKGLYGHMGIGGLCVGSRVTSMKPWREGGTGGSSRSLIQPEGWPEHMEAGTLNLLGLASLKGGLSYLATQPLSETLAHHQQLRMFLCSLFQRLSIPYLGQGDPERYVGTVSFWLPTVDPHTLSGMLDASFGIATRAGLHCAPLAHTVMNTISQGTVRVSVGRSTTEQELHVFAVAIEQICHHLAI